MGVWLLPVLGRVVLAYCAFPIVLKKNVGMHSRKKRFFWQFFFAAVISSAAALVAKKFVVNPAFFMILAIGFVNAFGAFSQWKAVDINLSKTSLFTMWDDIIAMSLGLAFLNEASRLNGTAISGILMSLAVVSIFAFKNYKKKKQQSAEGGKELSLYLNILNYSLIWGVAIFFIRFFGAKKGVPALSFVSAWYLGALLAASIIWWLAKDKHNASVAQEKLKLRDYLFALSLSLLILSSLALHYASLSLAPLVFVQPIFLVSEMVFPALLGLYLFKEIKHLDAGSKILFGLGIASGVLVALSL